MIDFGGARCILCDDDLPADTADERIPRAISRLRLVCAECYGLVVDSEEDDDPHGLSSTLRRAFADTPERASDAVGWGARDGGRKAWLTAHARPIAFYPEEDVHLVRVHEAEEAFAIVADGRAIAVAAPVGVDRDLYIAGAIEEALGLDEDAVSIAHTTSRHVIIEIADEDELFERVLRTTTARRASATTRTWTPAPTSSGRWSATRAGGRGWESQAEPPASGEDFSRNLLH
ncbi:hypothetical protein GCM10025867_49940 (plasmid) [Frondihabitans sucicola]|uniref:Uncharacterized protein n=1 Tax=Frondihabitans sucicola TaxID=1268041 RepID=A0ABN6Y6E4_9MICO|nr:hypothetical protein [Frondihabitans sucicola]BDZ52753.1 hypothetical protein GCM10025867_49940 [Frondihabitans sucicola]